MKYILLFILLAPLLAFSEEILLENGIYQCVEGNNESICDQELKVIPNEREVPGALKVSYVGWCGYQGPYIYYCQDNTCSDGVISFQIVNEKEYLWENKPHGFKCRFLKAD